MKPFEEKIKNDLYNCLLSLGEVGEILPETPDLDDKWQPVAESYLPDGIREFAKYPKVSLGWMMYVGMALAKFWDEDWGLFSNVDDIYMYMRDKRGFDCMDEYIREVVLGLKDEAYDKTEQLVQMCAHRVYHLLHNEGFEPGTEAAFRGYVACIHQLYLMGAAVQFHRMGYKMVGVK